MGRLIAAAIIIETTKPLLVGKQAAAFCKIAGDIEACRQPLCFLQFGACFPKAGTNTGGVKA
jgi:hypothetical protein